MKDLKVRNAKKIAQLRARLESLDERIGWLMSQRALVEASLAEAIRALADAPRTSGEGSG